MLLLTLKSVVPFAVVNGLIEVSKRFLEVVGIAGLANQSLELGHVLPESDGLPPLNELFQEAV